MTRARSETAARPAAFPQALARSVVLIGLMGAGKTSVGLRLAQMLGARFIDSDDEIEQAANLSVPEIFERYGEEQFRAGERRVLARLLSDPPAVIATGGGAFMDPATRALIAERGVSVWLRAGLDVLVQRTAGRTHRPLLNRGDPRKVLGRLIETRYPVYAGADLTVESLSDQSHEQMATRILEALVADGRAFATGARAGDRVAVALGERSYDILIGGGLLARAGELVGPLLPRPFAVIVTDETVAGLHLDTLRGGLAAAGIESEAVVLPPGEATKSMAWLTHLLERLLELKVERDDILLAFGGGVIGDLAGFAAAVLRRGVGFVQVPTTLLAQVDSSVGGKTGVNAPQGKNLIGAFHQPRLVLADTDVLGTLSPRDFLAGYGEVVKYGLLGDEAFFEWLEANGPALAAGDPAARAHAVRRSCEMKADIVARDETERGDRALLNLGHTFGHALEAATGYSDRLLHGEAVAIGCALAFEVSARMGLCAQEAPSRVRAHLDAMGMRKDLADIPGELPDADGLIALMAQDKKVRQGRLAFILARGIGGAFVTRDADMRVVRATLADALAVRG